MMLPGALMARCSDAGGERVVDLHACARQRV